MTMRHINSTGRKEIPRSAVDVVMLSPGVGEPRAVATLDLSRLKFAAKMAVVIEAYRGASLIRFECGTVGRMLVPRVLNLGGIDPGGPISFRVKISEGGIIKGLSPRITPRGEGDEPGREVLLPVVYVDLGQRIFKVGGDVDEPPSLLLNDRIDGMEDRWKNDPMFKGAIVIASFEMILRRLVDSEPDDDDPEDWRNRWVRYCTEVLGGDDRPSVDCDDEEKETWVDSNVNAFANHAAFVDSIISRAKETADE